jgi:thiamine-phosphate pyrophosphorylase
MNARAVAPLRGLYAITPEAADTAWLVRKTRDALEGGASIVQYRSKSGGAALKRTQAQALLGLCRAHGARFLINDDVELAREFAADGVHLGKDDAPLASARAVLGATAWIGASSYADLDRAVRLAAGGADYLAFGAMFASPTKPEAERAPLSLFARARTLIGIPLVAIGGITLANAAHVVQAGADAIAVVSALYDAPDTRAAARAFCQLFSSSIALADTT